MVNLVLYLVEPEPWIDYSVKCSISHSVRISIKPLLLSFWSRCHLPTGISYSLLDSCPQHGFAALAQPSFKAIIVILIKNQGRVDAFADTLADVLIQLFAGPRLCDRLRLTHPLNLLIGQGTISYHVVG